MSEAEPRRLSDRQRLAWLRLIRSDNVGPASFRQLIARFGSAEAALEALPDMARRGGAAKPVRVASISDAERELDLAERLSIRFLTIGESDYPPLLRQIPRPPPLVAVKGVADIFRKPGVAVVGARNASLAGIKIARSLARTIGGEGFAIVSGLARGIDTAAHEGSLVSGTVAVFAGGLDKPYPSENTAMANAIASRGGALISEMPLGWSPRAIDFPRRNRLIAGLSYGLVVVEAAQRSGSLISARLAGEQGRLVFAVPGSPLDPRSSGSNGLLKDGAILVTESDDVIRALMPLIGEPPTAHPLLARDDELADPPMTAPLASDEPDDDGRARVLESLSPIPTDLDEIVRHTGLSASQVHVILLELHLAGRIEHHSGNAVSLHDPGN